MTQAKPSLCQLICLAAIVAVVAADILPAQRPLGPRGPHHPKLVKRPLRGPPPPRGPPHPHFRPQPVHLGRQPSLRPHQHQQHQQQRPKFGPPGGPAKHFSPSPPAQAPHYVPPVMSSNEGAIHTIPAPNLGPNSGRVAPPQALVTSMANPILPPNTFDSGYKVHEDPAKSSFGLPYYAPDPDPSRPALQLPITSDPNSRPSNKPFEFYVQQQQQQHHEQPFSISHQQQQQFSASVPQAARVPAPKPSEPQVTSFVGDPNSRFLQAFQDQYHSFDALRQAQAAAAAAEQDDDKNKNDIDYDSGAEVRYSFAPAPAAGSLEQDDASSDYSDDEEDEEILEESGGNFGDKLKPKRVKKN